MINKVEIPQMSDQPHNVYRLSDDALGEIGYVVIDRAINGSAAGGIRFSPDVTVDEVARLARVMTLKWGFLNMPMGGGKAGINADLDHLGVDRSVLMRAFGRSIAPLVKEKIFFPGIDLGTTFDDLVEIMLAAGTPLKGDHIDGSLCTALTVFETIKQILKSSGLRFQGLSFAVEGFGKVGSKLAELLCNQGATLVGLSTLCGALYSEKGLDLSKLLVLKGQYGDHLIFHYQAAEILSLESLIEKPVDLLVPGARPDTINDSNVERVSAKLIVPIANLPITNSAEEKLLGRGIIVVPDFVANCGGILASSMHGIGFNLSDAQYLIQNIFSLVILEILQISKLQHKSIRSTAEAVAWQNHKSFLQDRNNPEKLIKRLAFLIKSSGFSGFYRRVAWRIYNRFPSISGPLRKAAIGRYGEMGLDVTLKRLKDFSKVDGNLPL